ncbi:MAG: LCP family protein [Eubacterium sp.]|nr:LCP family protein [Eubacterium sp.]
MKKKSAKKGIMIVVMIVIIAILVSIIGMLYVQGKLSKINRTTSEVLPEPIPVAEQTFEADEESGPDTIQPEKIEWKKVTAIKAEEAPHVTNILLIGQDARSGEGRQRSDTMILVSINSETKLITLVSFMRDMYVPIPGYDANRINAAYAFGGMPLLDEVIEQNFGVPIDGNIEVNLDGFLEAMSTVGDLEIELSAEEAAYMNENPALGSSTDTPVESWALTEGINYLTPTQALAYARMRHIGNSDYDRVDRQRKVIMSAFNKLMASGLPTQLALSDSILPCLTTDMTQSQIMMLIKDLQSTSLNPESYRIPLEGTYTSETVHGMAVLVPDLQANAEFLQKVLYGNSGASAATGNAAGASGATGTPAPTAAAE